MRVGARVGVGVRVGARARVDLERARLEGDAQQLILDELLLVPLALVLRPAEQRRAHARLQVELVDRPVHLDDGVVAHHDPSAGRGARQRAGVG